MNHYITALEDIGLIADYEGLWGPLLMLDTKPHQKNFSDINTFYLEVMR